MYAVLTGCKSKYRDKSENCKFFFVRLFRYLRVLIRSDEIPFLMPEVSEFEPHEALDGKEDGLFFYRKIIEESRAYLQKNGVLLFEIGYDQGEAVSELMTKAGYSQVVVKKDLAGLDRVVCGMYNKRVVENSSRTKM